jgi:hypothetical protein
MQNNEIYSQNLKILSIIKKYLKENKSLRFEQALYNLELNVPNIDKYYESNSVTLKNLAKKIEGSK